MRSETTQETAQEIGKELAGIRILLERMLKLLERDMDLREKQHERDRWRTR